MHAALLTAATGSALLLLAACAAPAARPPTVVPVVIDARLGSIEAFPPRLGQGGCVVPPPAALLENPPYGADLVELHALSRVALSRAGLQAFDGASAWMASDAFLDLAYHTAPLIDGDRRALLVSIEAPGPWTAEVIDRVMREYVTMPASIAGSEAGPPCFVVFGATPPTPVRYLFGNAWYGWFESKMMATLADRAEGSGEAATPGAAELLGAVDSAARDIGLDPSNRIEAYDRLLAALPRLDRREGWQPVGSLLGAGLWLGEALRDRDHELQWQPATSGEAMVLALVDRRCGGMLRPIDFTVQAYATAPRPLAERYIDWALQQVSACRERGPTRPLEER